MLKAFSSPLALPSRLTTKASSSRPRFLRGDSLIEVMFSIGIFGLVAIGSVGVMNRGLYTVQNTLEITMARNEIDAQAEALRFIHAAYITEKNSNQAADQGYSAVWRKIIQATGNNSNAPSLPKLSDEFLNHYAGTACSSQSKPNSFVINYRLLGGANLNNVYVTSLANAVTHPRLLFNNDDTTLATHGTSSVLNSAQGIWVTTVRSGNDSGVNRPLKNIEYFDFYIRTCWDRLGGGTPNTISTTIRLYNPDYAP